MQYRTLSNQELVRVAEHDARYLTDPLFAELVARVRKDVRSQAYSGSTSCHATIIPTDGRPSHVR